MAQVGTIFLDIKKITLYIAIFNVFHRFDQTGMTKYSEWFWIRKTSEWFWIKFSEHLFLSGNDVNIFVSSVFNGEYYIIFF